MADKFFLKYIIFLFHHQGGRVGDSKLAPVFGIIYYRYGRRKKRIFD
jgi:hypothetical protein